MQQKHGLPACEPKVSNHIEGGISASFLQSAFGGKLKKFELVIEKGEVDMPSLIMNKKEIIYQLIYFRISQISATRRNKACEICGGRRQVS